MINIEKNTRRNISSKLFFTNNAVESLNGTLNSFLNKGTLSIEKFAEIMIVILQYYSDNRRAREKKISLYVKETNVSTLMIELVQHNTSLNLLRGKSKVIFRLFCK